MTITAVWLASVSGLSHAADVSVHINLPAPVVVLPAPPHMVWLSGPRIYIAFGSPHQIFFQDDNYYLNDHDVWYAGPGYGGPWARININVLPPGLRRYRHEQWEEYQREARPRYRDDDDHDHRNFVGWKEKKEKREKHSDRKYHREHERADNRGRGNDRDRGDERDHEHRHGQERDRRDD